MKKMTAIASSILLAASVVACGTTSGGSDENVTGAGTFTAPDVPMKKSLGAMEGQVNILAWPRTAPTTRRWTGSRRSRRRPAARRT